MDTYSKTILTIIAIAVCAIAVKLIFPPSGFKSAFARGPTRADFIALREVKEPEARKTALRNLLTNIPLVWVQGGEISADVVGTVSIEN